ncbi:MAG: hypothetical protein QNJ46_14650 [Leptolyngbyaceae cyanobacterium MO_188.B28]|nr:hypothetical protein [Leptolyngbyaceae cyanobacterium MO_188.B28]
MSAANALPVMISDNSTQPSVTHEGMTMDNGDMAGHPASSHTLLLGGGVFLLLVLAFLGGMFFRRSYPL